MAQNGTFGMRMTRRWTAWGAAAAVGASMLVIAVPSSASAVSPPTVNLGAGASYAVLTAATVGNTSTTVLRGDMGLTSGTAPVGFPPGVVTGVINLGTPAQAGYAGLLAAYNDANSRTVGATAVPAADLIGLTIPPGLYTSAAAIANTGLVKLDGLGDPNAVFIFQIGGAINAVAASEVRLINGAQAKNVFWQTDATAAIGANAKFAGTILAHAAVAVGANTIFNGRVFSVTAAIALDNNQFYSSPPTVVIDGGEAAYTTDTSPTITGSTTERAPSTVQVTVNDEILSATPDAGGSWSATPVGLLENGTYPIVASVVDGAGNTGSFTQDLEVDTVLPDVTIDGGAAVTTNDLTPTISGTTNVAVGELVTVTMVRDIPAASFTRMTLVQPDATWNITPNVLSPGEWAVRATVTDPAGNVNYATQILLIDVTAPVAAIDGGAGALTNDPTPTITGTAVGATVTATLDGQPLTPIDQVGDVWSVTYTGSPLGNGSHHVSMTVSDPAGNTTTVTQTLTVDTVLPLISINPGPNDATNDRTPTISGTTEVALGANVSVSIDDASPMTAVVQSDGWNVTPSALLATGEHAVVATVVDPAGNIGTSTQTLTIDITPPTVTIDGGSSRTTPDSTPTITGGSADVAVGSAVTVSVDGQTLPTTIGSGGTWSVTAAALDNDTYVVNVNVIDGAGNVGSDSQSLTVNAVTPTVVFSNGETATTEDATPLISGSTTATVGTAVVVSVNGQTLHASVQPGGSWNVTAAQIADGTYTVNVTVSPLGENSGAASQSLTIDTSTSPTTTPTTSPTTTPTTSPTTTPTTSPTTTPTTTPTTSPTTSPTTPGPQADFTSVGPKRVFDTRAGQSPNALVDVVEQQVGGGHVLRVQMTPLGSYVPASGVGAVSLNVTATGSTVAGFITVYACGARELVASVNFPGGGTVANAVVAPVSADGAVCFFANAPTDIVVDINGWFAAGAAFTAVGPKRVFDTRADNSPDALRAVAKASIAANSMIEVQLTDLAGYIPTTGVGSVSLNIAVTNPHAAGFITAYSCGARALVSSLNYVAGQTVANAVIVPVSESGTVCFYSLATTDLIVDINGWMRAGSGFTGVNPARVLDTRVGESANALRTVRKAKIGGSYVLEVKVTDLPGLVPASSVAAVSLNVTAANPEAAGFVTVFACGTMEEVASLNYVSGQTVGNAVLASVSATGTICFYSNAPTDVVVDINGWIGS